MIDEIIVQIEAQEGRARRLAELADSLERDGHEAAADAIRDAAHKCWGKSKELRKSLAVLRSVDGRAARDGE